MILIAVDMMSSSMKGIESIRTPLHFNKQLYDDVDTVINLLQSALLQYDSTSPASASTSNVFDNICVSCKSAISILIKYQNNSSSTSNMESNIDEIMKLRLELEECRDDLKKDEEIFAMKMKELKATRKAMTLLEKDNNKLKLDLQQQKNLENNVDINKSAIQSQTITNATAEPPNVSNLIEDIEVINKEKEQLLIDKQLSEEKYQQIHLNSEKQIESYKSKQKIYYKQMKALELTINQKEYEIANLKKFQTLSNGAAQMSSHNGNDDGDESHSKNNTDASIASVSENDLRILKEEYNKLNNKIIKNEETHGSILKTLQEQIDKQKAESMHSMNLIKELEVKNSELLGRLQKVNQDKLHKKVSLEIAEVTSASSGSGSSHSRRSSVPVQNNLNATCPVLTSNSSTDLRKHSNLAPPLSTRHANDDLLSSIPLTVIDDENPEISWRACLKHIELLASMKQSM